MVHEVEEQGYPFAYLFDDTQEILEDAGLPAYEISNHAAPGAECRHNVQSWLGGEYVGIAAQRDCIVKVNSTPGLSLVSPRSCPPLRQQNLLVRDAAGAPVYPRPLLSSGGRSRSAASLPSCLVEALVFIAPFLDGGE